MVVTTTITASSGYGGASGTANQGFAGGGSSGTSNQYGGGKGGWCWCCWNTGSSTTGQEMVVMEFHLILLVLLLHMQQVVAAVEQAHTVLQVHKTDGTGDGGIGGVYSGGNVRAPTDGTVNTGSGGGILQLLILVVCLPVVQVAGGKGLVVIRYITTL